MKEKISNKNRSFQHPHVIGFSSQKENHKCFINIKILTSPNRKQLNRFIIKTISKAKMQ